MGLFARGKGPTANQLCVGLLSNCPITENHLVVVPTENLRNITFIYISQILKAPASDIVLRNESVGLGDATRVEKLNEEHRLWRLSTWGIVNCVLFFLGLGVFLLVTDHVQRPYLQFSAKRWGLITGLRVYLSSSFFTMGFKVVAPLLAVFLTWPALGFQALVAVAPFLIGCAAQHAFKTILDKHQSSCWPLIPIIF
ncbi:hypothetical protein PVK06_015572 [Gossypium arboreum]|uniref:Uncharacterized protein n=1 Tax=Gossypium arboreum TaxID=29729 RepID=A0ABR0PYK2_GOSAR|nr:hypothetical protein PVK06_015572 [Gossypium arboreum]